MGKVLAVASSGCGSRKCRNQSKRRLTATQRFAAEFNSRELNFMKFKCWPWPVAAAGGGSV